MSGEVEVVEVAAANSFLPNLTICVDKEEDDTDLPEVSYTEEKDEEDDRVNKPDVKLKMTMFPRKKIYENKRLESDSSLGLTPSEARRRREKRAKRFASPLVGVDEINHPEEQGGKEEEWEEEGEEMRKRVKIIEEHVAQHNLKHDAADDGYIRTNALHLRGVDNMSTDDIFGYFGRMDPKRIEWIDDSSCNVVWGGGTETAQAYHRIVQNQPTPTPICPGRRRMDDDDDTIDLLEDEEQDAMDVDTEVKDKQDPIEGNPVEVNSLRPCNKPFKTTVLEVRYARLGDRKVLGAAKRSKYYLNHGNPNYGGTKGLLSSSFRKRYQMNQARKELGDMNIPVHGGGGRRNGGGSGRSERSERSKEEIEDDQLIESSAKDLNGAVPVQSSGDSGDSDHSDGYGTMVADQVAQKVKAARTMNDQDFHLQVTAPNSNVRSRLGKRSHESNSNTRNGSVFDRLPPSLRNRLGNKQSGNPPVEPRHNRPPGGSKMRMDRRGDSPMLSKRVKGDGRSLKRYSPSPWSESDEDLF